MVSGVELLIFSPNFIIWEDPNWYEHPEYGPNVNKTNLPNDARWFSAEVLRQSLGFSGKIGDFLSPNFAIFIIWRHPKWSVHPDLNIDITWTEQTSLTISVVLDEYR